ERSSLLLTPPLPAASQQRSLSLRRTPQQLLGSTPLFPTDSSAMSLLPPTLLSDVYKKFAYVDVFAMSKQMIVSEKLFIYLITETHSSRTFSHHGPTRPLIEAQTQLKHKKESVKTKHPQLHYESNICASSRR
ncbi:hypothetical protein S245_035762, partial [Arachis hypogaea]